MADLTITAANVLKGTGAIISTANAGETITQGQPVYINSSDKEAYRADADASLAAAAAVGIALNSASNGQPIKYQTGGTITLGTGTEGVVYCVSATAGGIAPVSDLTTGDYVTILGVGNDASGLIMNLNATGFQVQ